MQTSESSQLGLSLDKLRRFSSHGYDELAPDKFLEAAEFCREWGINSSDVRYVVLERCFQLSQSLWGPDEEAAASSSDAEALERVWRADLSDVLNAATVDEGVVLALHLEDEIRSVLAAARLL